jgi:hypothetical protein
MPNTYVRCGDCDLPLDEDLNEPNRQPCPACGSTSRTFSRDAATTAEFKEKVGLKVKDPLLTGKNKIRTEQVCGDEIRTEQVCGDELNHATGKWFKKERVIDRQNDKYFESVTDPETGETLHHCDQPLSEHFGHGSAKPPASS